MSKEHITLQFLEMLIDRLSNIELTTDSLKPIVNKMKNYNKVIICLKCIDHVEFFENGNIKTFRTNHRAHETNYKCDCNTILEIFPKI